MGADEKRTYIKNAAREIVENMRASNAEFCERTGQPSRVSEADYVKAEEELKAVMYRMAGLDKTGRSR